MDKRLQKELNTVLLSSSKLCMSTKDSVMRISHVVFATFAEKNIIAHIVIDAMPSEIDSLMTELKTNYESESDNKLDLAPDQVPQWSQVLKNTINNVARSLPSGEILSLETFFLNIFETNDPVIQILSRYKITAAMLGEHIQNSDMASNVSNLDEDEPGAFKKKISTKTPFLDDFGRDLTAMAGRNELDPVYNRDDETERVAQVLARRKKNNPVLIGDPGCVVGTTKIRVKKISDITIHNIITI